MSKLDKILTPKQQSVLKEALTNQEWTLLINHGGVRAGKTVIDNLIFLYQLREVANIAKKVGKEHPLYILGGVSSRTIANNVLNPLSDTYGINFKFDKWGNFELFGVTVVQAYTGSIGGLAGIRGMSAFGAYINEASLANEEVFDEIRKRCSEGKGRVLCDTNPDVPTHWLKKKYIDNPNNSKEIISFHYSVDDNPFLSERYVNSLKATTPSGMFYDRAILGLWVAGEGAVYRDFDERTMLLDDIKVSPNAEIYAGIDWGYEHQGSLVVLADIENKTYLLEEHTAQYKEIDYWVDVAKKVCAKYGRIRFYADSARPEHVARFNREGLRCINANKSVLSGIEEVAKRIKEKRFFVRKAGIQEFLSEIYEYVWDAKSGMPVKDNDHVLDAIRYAIYTKNHKPSIIRTFKGF
ncbi:PBSX family phage terminase large subunit [Ligilactobacillus agilis]|uniref:PBSX family phage terminase large subunit n=1 Tax=Ligilactobacillus agilis TaxID=1601 RepID=UPI00195D8F63|nr:PBSX family phage terminase large subunit [Ligilactobacillus agilis]MBM6763114.1 PBSX family phage terminase large subunit [Ligilactobacillus agilis]